MKEHSYFYAKQNIILIRNSHTIKQIFRETIETHARTFLPLILLVIGTVNNASSDLFSTFAHILRCIRLKGIYIEGCYKPLRILKV